MRQTPAAILALTGVFACLTVLMHVTHGGEAPATSAAKPADAGAEAPAFPAPELPAQEVKKDLKQEDEEKYGAMILPSRLPGIGFPALKDCKYFGRQKFSQIDMWEPSRISGEITLGHFQKVAVFVDYDAPNPKGPREATVQVGAWASRENQFWKLMSDTMVDIGGKKGFIDTVKVYTEKERKKTKDPKAAILAGGGAAEKKTLAGSRAELAKRYSAMISDAQKAGQLAPPNRTVIKAKAHLFPLRLSTTRNEYEYWNYAFAEPGCIVKAAIDQYWIYGDQRKTPRSAPRLMLAMTLPEDKTRNHAFFRSCSVLTTALSTGAGGGPRIHIATNTTSYVPPILLDSGKSEANGLTFFDDNLNGIYAEPGVDSIMTGAALALAGPRISIGNRVFDMAFVQDRNTRKATVTLKPSEAKTGAIQLTFASQGAARICMIQQGKEYYSIATAPEDGQDKKRPGEPIVHTPLVVPVGTYKVVGGLVAVEGRGKGDMTQYGIFTGGRDIKVEEGKVTVVTMGQSADRDKPVDMTIKLAEGNDDRRIVTLTYPVGAHGERYAEMFQRIPLPKLDLTSKTNKDVRAAFTFEYKSEKDAFMETGFRFDRAVMNPKNGPFVLTSEVELGIFRNQKIEVELPHL